MFNLEQEVDAWSRSVQGNGCGQMERIEELQDHLYCEIGRLQEQGLTEEQAFLKATQRLGEADDLGAEYAKNNSVLSTLWAMEQAHIEALSNHDLSPQKAASITIVHSLLFAAAMLIVPLLLEDAGDVSLLLFAVLIPLWFITFTRLPGMRHAVRCEWHFLKRVFSSVR